MTHVQAESDPALIEGDVATVLADRCAGLDARARRGELVRRRHGFMRGSLRVFPKALQSQVSRYVDDRMAQHAFDQIADIAE